jgi:hypothetical protein
MAERTFCYERVFLHADSVRGRVENTQPVLLLLFVPDTSGNESPVELCTSFADTIPRHPSPKSAPASSLHPSYGLQLDIYVQLSMRPTTELGFQQLTTRQGTATITVELINTAVCGKISNTRYGAQQCPCARSTCSAELCTRLDWRGVQSSFGCSEVHCDLQIPFTFLCDQEVLWYAFLGGEPSSLYLCAFQTVC